MTINWIDLISVLLAIVSFVWALIERSRRMPLWWTLKGLEQGAMSNMSLYDNFRKKYASEDRKEIPLEEFLVQINNSFGHWNSHHELIKGIRSSVDIKNSSKEAKLKDA